MAGDLEDPVIPDLVKEGIAVKCEPRPEEECELPEWAVSERGRAPDKWKFPTYLRPWQVFCFDPAHEAKVKEIVSLLEPEPEPGTVSRRIGGQQGRL